MISGTPLTSRPIRCAHFVPEPVTLAAILGTAGGAVAGLVASAVQTLFVESRKQRVADYNAKLDKLRDALNSLQSDAVTYWTSDAHTSHLAVRIKLQRPALNEDMLSAFRDQKGLLDVTSLQAHFNAYWRIITSGSFDSPTQFQTDPTIPEHAAIALQDCRNCLASAKCKLSFKHLFSNEIR